jgi:hypothetical protein
MRRHDSDIFGKVPTGATHWSVRRKAALTWEWCTFAAEDGIVRQEFPVAELSLAQIRDRWGHGTYRVMFVSLGQGVRQVFGNGKIFELTASQRGGTPRPVGRDREEPAPAEARGDMVRVLLKAGYDKTTPAEVYEALAVPMGMGLSSLFAGQDRTGERLDALERRLAAIEAKLAPAAEERAPAPAPIDGRLDRLLDRLESIEGHLARPAPTRRPSPTGRRTPR